MRNVIAGFFLAMTVPALAAEQQYVPADVEDAALTAVQQAAPAVVTPAPPAPVVIETEAGRQWKSLKAQEQWIARLKKQLQGETQQLSALRATVARNYKLDPDKLESGAYDFDEKSQKFVEKS